MHANISFHEFKDQPLSVHLAPEGFENQTRAFTTGLFLERGRLFICNADDTDNPWSQNTWINARIVHVPSIGAAVRHLKEIQRDWCGYADSFYRRTALIQESLPKLDAAPLTPAQLVPKRPVGAFTLLDHETMLYSPSCSSPFPGGIPDFVALTPPDGPPSRAYLKLLEAMAIRRGQVPEEGQVAVEIGAAPGGWTWVLANYGAHVYTFDRAPLDPTISALGNVEHKIGDGFKVKPSAFGQVDWLCTDIVCYPERQLAYVKEWIESGKVANVIATLKFQGADSYHTIREALSIEGVRIVHLYHNKHEVTLLWTKSEISLSLMQQRFQSIPCGSRPTDSV